MVDGEYVVKLTDDAGNELVGSDDNKFKIETIVPVITPIVLSDGLLLVIKWIELRLY